MKLIANQQYVDEQGRTHNRGDEFEVTDQQKAEQLIREGKARKAEQEQPAR